MTPRQRLELLSKELRERNPTLDMNSFKTCALGWGAGNIPQFEAEGWALDHEGMPYLTEGGHDGLRFCFEDAMQFFVGDPKNEALYDECFREATYRRERHDLSKLPGSAVADHIDRFMENDRAFEAPSVCRRSVMDEV